MQTIFTIAIIVVVVMVGLGILGAIFNFAKGVIRALFSFAILAALVLLAIWFFNGQTLPF